MYKVNRYIILIVVFLVMVSTSFIVKPSVVHAVSPTFNSITYTAAGDTTKYYYVTIDLNDVYTGVSPLTADNVNPQNDSWWEPRWSGGGDHRKYPIDMYNQAPGVNKYVLINTDYFCEGPCSGSTDVPPGSGNSPAGNPGSPQGLFMRGSVLYHRSPSATPNATYPNPPRNRAALTFNSSKKATIASYNWFSNTSGIKDAVGGGPIILQNGTSTCNPEGSDLNYRCGTALQKRSGACISSDGYKLHLIVNFNGYTTNWSNLSSFMKNHLGCYNGMQFDGGASPALVVGGTTYSSGRMIGSGLMIRFGYASRSGVSDETLPVEPVEQPDANENQYITN